MKPVYLNQSTYDSLPLTDLHRKEYQNLIFGSPTNQVPTSSLSCPSVSYIFQDSQNASDIGKQRWHDQEADKDDWSSVCGPEYEKDKEKLNRSSDDKDSSSAAAKWKCSDEAKLMQKMSQESNSPTWQHQLVRRGPSNSTNRVCADCNTTSTPLWRTGPNGPKSLCNACGIRQRKARKAMEEAGWCVNTTRIMHKKEKERQVVINKNKSQSRGRRIGFTLRRNGSVVFQQPLLPRDEVLEGALLLMYLSCRFIPY